MIELFQRAEHFGANTAIVDLSGHYSFRELLDKSAAAASVLLDGKKNLQETRVAFLVSPGIDFVVTQWGIWRAGGIAVPLCGNYPIRELKYFLKDSGAEILVAAPEFKEKLKPLSEEDDLKYLESENWNSTEPVVLPDIQAEQRAMIVYTSGTTNRPKGVVMTHRTIQSQIKCLVDAWQWSEKDRSLHVLPLHHIHGLINALCCPLWAGAICEMLPKFDAEKVWKRIESKEISILMAVPTIYTKLIKEWEKVIPARQRLLTKKCKGLRLMVSGSAALPVSVFNKWSEVGGQPLLERYGMTEIGMALSNPINGERRAGMVGQCLPGVEVRLIDTKGLVSEIGPGEIEVKGANIFKEYWQQSTVTKKAFHGDWFRTGDIALLEEGYYKILGRAGIDIIKTGGYKVSALEIEGVLLTHSAIEECAVIGVPDEEWGERVAVSLVLNPGKDLCLPDLRDWAKKRLAIYKIPTRIQKLDTLPRNAMGKIIKPEISKMFQAVDRLEVG
ncbi:MAG TPA: long-chain fatty acid--CoA ligase [Verrucomicrobiales bacterium]|nr:long-chain fatty acid--CoA ligase [Verrucomicrobiales bacterium]